MKFEAVGYHGTDREDSENILKNGYRYSDNTAWFGSGIYFFEDLSKITDGYQEAIDWVINIKKFDHWAIFKALIKSDCCIDLIYDSDDKKYFNRMRKKLLESHIKLRRNINEFTDAVVFEKLASFKEIEVIRAFVDAARQDYPSYLVRRPQIQLCVKKRECIQKNERIEIGDY